MEPAQVLPHLATSLRMALGEQTVQDTPPGPIRGAIVRYLGIYVLPWPHGRIKAFTGAFSTPSAGWQRDRELVVELIERFAVTPPDKLGVVHPKLGRMNARDWDVLQYRHLDHHLRQFGA